eukprot:c584_g1_i2.p1 GENE.c584_g1_i2~~c584_g1_i2.p1  ORF type:complete len:574 (+),score=83.17 c584_g1_i2:30-1751(+)
MRKQKYDVLPTASDGLSAPILRTQLPWFRLVVVYAISLLVCTSIGVGLGLYIRDAIIEINPDSWGIGLIYLSRSGSPTSSITPSQTSSITSSGSSTQSPTSSGSPSRTVLASESHSTSTTGSTSPSQTMTPSQTSSQSYTPSHSPTTSLTPQPSPSISLTPRPPPMSVDFDWKSLPDSATCPNFNFFYTHLRDRMLARWPDKSITKELMLKTHRKTLESYEMSCGTGLAINGMLYASVQKYYIYRPTSFLNLLGLAFVKYPHLAMMLPPVEFIWDQTDAPLQNAPPSELAPVLGYTGRSGPETTSIAVPDYSYDMSETISSRESPMRTWDAAYHALQQYSAAVPYEKRIKKALFRGAGNRYRFGMTDYLIKTYNFNGTNDWLDYDMIGLQNGWVFKAPSVPTSNYSNYAVQIYIDGNGASARFKYLLLSGSPVIKFIPPVGDNMQFEMWYFPFLEPNVHYVPISRYDELEGAVKSLLDNPERAKRMADDAAAVMLRYLHPDSHPCYYMATLAALVPKLSYQPRVHKGLFPVAFPTNATKIDKHTFSRIHQFANRNMSAYSRTPISDYFDAWFD